MSHLDFLITLGREFCNVLLDVDPDLCGQDAYEVFRAGLQEEPTIARLSDLSDADVTRVRDACVRFLETDEVTESQIRDVVDRSLSYWKD